MSGNTLSYNFSYGNGGTGCGNAISGTAIIGPTLLTGVFDGQDCTGQAVTNGSMTVLLTGGVMTALPISGTWEGAGDLPANIGGGKAPTSKDHCLAQH